MRRNENSADVRDSKESPLIAIVGATSPEEPYTPDMGLQAGYVLRHLVEEKGGTLFTGGVEGVGVDAYLGVIHYGIDQLRKPRIRAKPAVMPDDHFFVLAPQFSVAPALQGRKGILYTLPQGYALLGSLNAQGRVDVQYGGRDMSERRRKLAEVADVIVGINGSSGTFDEMQHAVRTGTPVVVLPFTGGAAQEMARLKEGTPFQQVAIDTELIHRARDYAMMAAMVRDLAYRR